MKQILLTLLLMALTLGTQTSPAAAQQIRTPDLTALDATIEKLDSAITAYQGEYKTARGKHYQALKSHTTAPTWNSATAPDKLTSKPTDQAATLADFWNSGKLDKKIDRLPFSFSIDVYSGPSGDGWTLTVWTVQDGITYTRVINHGPEAHRQAEWQQVTQ